MFLVCHVIQDVGVCAFGNVLVIMNVSEIYLSDYKVSFATPTTER